MNQVFDWNRFLQLARTHLRTNMKAYLISCLVLAGVTVVLFLLMISTRQKSIDAGNQFLVYFIAIYGGLFIFTGNAFQTYQRPRVAMSQLMLPASVFEKFLLGWLVSFVGYTICANAVFFVVRYVALQYYSAQGYEVSGFLDDDRFRYQPNGLSLVWVLLMVYIFSHAFALYGSLVFRKMAVLKTALTLLLVILIYWAVNGLLYSALFQLDIQQAPLLPMMPLFLEEGGMTYQVGISSWPYWLLALSIAVSSLLWVMSYHKLREKEA